YVGGCSGTTRFGYTWTNGDILEGWNGLGSFTTTENTSALLRWVNQTESTNAADLAARTSGDYCNHTMAGPGHDCELRALGGTPLASLLTAADSYANPIKTADTLSTCRPYSVILITDGNESCGGNPVTSATTLNGHGIKTYVV